MHIEINAGPYRCYDGWLVCTRARARDWISECVRSHTHATPDRANVHAERGRRSREQDIHCMNQLQGEEGQRFC